MKQKTEQETRRETPFDADATRAKLADVYAVAAFGACDAQGVSTAEFLAEFDAFVENACDAFPKFEEILASPMVSVDEKLRIVDAVCREATPISKTSSKRSPNEGGRNSSATFGAVADKSTRSAKDASPFALRRRRPFPKRLKQTLRPSCGNSSAASRSFSPSSIRN